MRFHFYTHGARQGRSAPGSLSSDADVVEAGHSLSWPQRVCTALIRFYQRRISVLTPPSCRFTPTCSQYALEAIERFGVWRGGLLALWRLCRCQPLCKGGHDPVPPAPRSGDEAPASPKSTFPRK